MSRTLITNGYVVTVDARRNVFPDGYVAIDGARISAVGPASQSPKRDTFDEVIDARGAIVLPGLINMHQHHWYTLFKGLADGYLLEDWVTQFLLPLSLNLTEEAMRVSSTLAGMEMLATGTTCSLNHSVTTTTPDLVKASIEPQRDLGIRQVYAKELRCRTPGNPRHPMSLDEALAAFEEEARRWDGADDGLVRFGMVIESNAHWVTAGISTEDLIVPRLRACKAARPAHQRAYRRRNILAGDGLSEVSAGNRPHRRALSDAARHPRSALDPDPLHPLHRARHRAHGAGRGEPGLHADQRVDPRRRDRTGIERAARGRERSRSAPTDRWSTIRSTWSSR